MTLFNRLKKGDSIGIYSPSSPITYNSPIRFKRAKDFLASKGFNITEGNLTGKRDFYCSGTIRERAEELKNLSATPTSAVSCRQLAGRIPMHYCRISITKRSKKTRKS